MHAHTHTYTQVMVLVEDSLREKASSFNPQDISNVLWAYAKLGLAPGEEVYIFS